MSFHYSQAHLVAGICVSPDGGCLTGCADSRALSLAELLDLENRWTAGQFFCGPELFFLRSLWERVGGIDETLAPPAAGYDLWLRFAQQRAMLHVVGREFVHTDSPRSSQLHPDLLRTRDAFLTRHSIPFTPATSANRKASLRIAFVNDHGFKYGAGIAHQRLAEAANLGGHHVIPIALSSDPPYDDNGAITTEAVVDALRAASPDLVVLGNMHSAAPTGHVAAEICRNFPTAAVLHDTWWLTGRCAYPGDCRRFLSAEGCNHQCPTWREYPPLEPDRVQPAWRHKRHLLHSDHAPALLANSRWMLHLAQKVLDTKSTTNPFHEYSAPCAAIRLAFPLDVFHPKDKAASRAQLGLPADRFLLLFSASSLDDQRKGIAHLVEALDLLQLKDITTVCVGQYAEGAQPALPDLRMMGYLTDPGQLATLYSAVDLFVGPSLEEALGQVYIEAAACGTPSVGYPIGGVPEAIRDGVTGRIASEVDPTALAAAIRELHDNPDLRRDMGRWGRIIAENQWSMATALHRLHTALWTTGLATRLGLSSGICLRPALPSLPPISFIPPNNPPWRALSGMAQWEGPYPQWQLPRCRWAVGSISTIEAHVPASGRYRLLLECFNSEPDQPLSVHHAGQCAGTRKLPVVRPPQTHIANFDLDLQQGANVIELRHPRWTCLAGSKRQQAILITQIAIVPWHEKTSKRIV